MARLLSLQSAPRGHFRRRQWRWRRRSPNRGPAQLDARHTGSYTGQDLQRGLVRLVFGLFAADIGIFQRPNELDRYIHAVVGGRLGLCWPVGHRCAGWGHAPKSA